MTTSVAYYDFSAGEGVAPQRGVIEALGYDPIQLTNAEFVQNADVMIFDAPAGTDPGSIGGSQAITNSVFAGRTVIVNDETGLSLLHEASDGEQVNFVNDGGRLANGPGGALTDGSLDDLHASNAGYLPVFALEDAEVAVLVTEDNPTHALMFALSAGEGWLIDSSVAVSAGLAHGDEAISAFVANEIAFGAYLYDLPESTLSSGADNFTATKAGEEIFALDGDDVIRAAGGDDLVHAGVGEDTLAGGAGDDFIWGGSGDDLVKGAVGADQLWGGAGIDNLAGNAGDDYLVAGSSNDLARGGAGADTLIGGTGDDTLYGSGGDDVISGGLGRDHMEGGGGADSFLFGPNDNPPGGASVDDIEGFARGSDKLDFSEFAHAFTFVDGETFTGAGHEIIILESVGVSLVDVDVDGDSVPDLRFTVQTTNGATITAGDFLF